MRLLQLGRRGLPAIGIAALGSASVIAYATLPVIAAQFPLAALVAAPGVTTLIVTWGRVDLGLALLVVAVMRWIRFALGWQAGFAGGEYPPASRLTQRLQRALPSAWTILYTLVFPGIPSGVAIGIARRRSSDLLLGALGVAVTQALWAVIFLISAPGVEEASNMFRAVSEWLYVSLVASWLAIMMIRRWRRLPPGRRCRKV